MTAKPQSLTRRKPRTSDEAPGREWADALRKLLDPAIIAILPDAAAWYALDPALLRWLCNTIAPYPWLNHVAFIALVLTLHGYASPARCVSDLATFLRWAIPAHYPNVAALEPEKALFAYFGDPPRPHGLRVLNTYTATQFNIRRYLASVSLERRTALAPFVLPELFVSGRLDALKQLMTHRQQERRKKNAFPVAKRLAHLAAAVRRRTRWLFDLDALVQEAVAAVKAGTAAFPVTIRFKGLSSRGDVTFRVWNRKAWFTAHLKAYSSNARSEYQYGRYSAEDDRFFLQVVGEIPEQGWFLQAVALGLLQGPDKLSPEAIQYAKEWSLPRFGISHTEATGVLDTHRSMSQYLRRARQKASGTPEDSRVLFQLEPLLAAAAVGQVAFMSIVFTAMRVGELQQVSLNRECMETAQMREFDDRTQQWIQARPRVFWHLYPKGKTHRERYYVHEYMVEAVLSLVRLYKRHHHVEALPSVAAAQESRFSHARQFPGKHPFLLQWEGYHLSGQLILHCMSFLLIEEVCRDQDGKQVQITPHLLRHGIAGWLRGQGMQLDEIMQLLKHVNIRTTEYYSRLDPEDLHQQLSPFLKTLADLVGIDPDTVRTVGDIENLEQEALKRYGMLRRAPGGSCGSLHACPVHFQCATCHWYIPRADGRREVEEKIDMHGKAMRFFQRVNEPREVAAHQEHRRDWDRILMEIDALAQVPLVSPPQQEVFKELGVAQLESELNRGAEIIDRFRAEGEDSHV